MEREKKKSCEGKKDIRYSLVYTQPKGQISSYLACQITLSLKHKVYSFKEMCKAALIGKQMLGYDFCETLLFQKKKDNISNFRNISIVKYHGLLYTMEVQRFSIKLKHYISFALPIKSNNRVFLRSRVKSKNLYRVKDI